MDKTKLVIDLFEDNFQEQQLVPLTSAMHPVTKNTPAMHSQNDTCQKVLKFGSQLDNKDVRWLPS